MNRISIRTTQPSVRSGRTAHDRQPPSDPLNLEPSTAYEVLTRQMVEDLVAEVAVIRSRIDTMFWVVIASVVTDALLRLAG